MRYISLHSHSNRKILTIAPTTVLAKIPLKFPDLDRDPNLQQHLIFCRHSEASLTLKTISLKFIVNFSLNCPYPEIIKIPLKIWIRVIILIINKV